MEFYNSTCIFFNLEREYVRILMLTSVQVKHSDSDRNKSSLTREGTLKWQNDQLLSAQKIREFM